MISSKQHHIMIWLGAILLLIASSTCRKANIITLPLSEEYIGFADMDWNGRAIEGMRTRARFVNEERMFIGVQFARFMGNLNEMDLSGGILAIHKDRVGDTLVVGSPLSYSTDSVQIRLSISEGDGLLETYILDEEADNWVVLEDWNPDTKELEVSFSLSYRRRQNGIPPQHSLAAEYVQLRNAWLSATVIN